MKVSPPARALSILRVIGPIYKFSKDPSSAVYFILRSNTSDDMPFRCASLSRM
jgi:hypothetical protein